MISDDQRSIGYIAGNMNYNGEIYDTAPNPYQLWKPGCFPRGEAPPPYEEVIGLGAATSCTSVSGHPTSHHHRTLPLSICGEVAVATGGGLPGDYQGYLSQAPQLLSSSAAAATAPLLSTTATNNLINININDAGTITSVAAGETHQVPTATISSLSATNNNSNTVAGMNSNLYK